MADIRHTGYLDNFSLRADEDPLSYDGRWEILSFTYGTHLSLEGGSVEVHTVTGGTAQTAAWVANAFTGDVECWGIPGYGNDLREGLRIYIHVQPESIYYNSGGSDTSGYRVRWNQQLGEARMWLERLDGGVGTVLDSIIGVGFPFGGVVLLRKIGSTIEFWMTTDGSGQTGWTQYLSGTDNAYTSGFFGIGTEQDDPNPGWIGFGGGQINRSQIYRYVSN